MTVTLQNSSRFGFWITLSDGEFIELSPRTKPVSIPKRELTVNNSLRKLLDRGLVQQVKSVTPKKKKKSPEKTPEIKVEKAQNSKK